MIKTRLNLDEATHQLVKIRVAQLRLTRDEYVTRLIVADADAHGVGLLVEAARARQLVAEIDEPVAGGAA